MMDGSGAGFVSSGSCGVDISESSGCNYKVQVYYQGIRNLDAFALTEYWAGGDDSFASDAQSVNW